jgi:hypothetical protein
VSSPSSRPHQLSLFGPATNTRPLASVPPPPDFKVDKSPWKGSRKRPGPDHHPRPEDPPASLPGPSDGTP